MNPPDETTRPSVLKNFPFPDLPSFLSEYNSDRRVRLSVDRQTALQWSTRGGSAVHVPRGLRGTVQFWMFAPYLAVAGYVVYIIATGQWWFLLGARPKSHSVANATVVPGLKNQGLRDLRSAEVRPQTEFSAGLLGCFQASF